MSLRAGRWADYGTFALYLLLALAFTWPTLSTATTAIMGDGKDGWQDTWEIWWVNRAISTGTGPYHFTTLYAPDGVTNFLHSLNPVEIWLAWPALSVSGPVLAFNVACWTALVVTAFGGYLLARDVSGSRAVAVIGGLALGFAPHQFGQLLSHMDVAAIQFFVLGIWTLFRSVQTRGRASLVWALWSGACLSASVLSHPYTWISLLIVAATLALCWTVSARGAQKWRPVRSACVAIAVGLLVTSPLLVQMVRTATGPDAPGQGESTPSEVSTYSADLAAFAIPSPFQPLWGKLSAEALRPLKGTLVEKVVFPGCAVLILAGLGILGKRTWRKALPWSVVALVGFLLSLGPSLQVGGQDTGVPLPAALFYSLPGSSILRVPARFDIITTLGLSVCVSLGAANLLRTVAERFKAVVCAALILLICLEFLSAPYRTSAFMVDPWYEAQRAQPDGALLEVPFDRLDARPEEAQIASGVQLAGGYLSRQPVYPLSRGVPPFYQFGLNKLPAAALPTGASLCQPVRSLASYMDILRLADVRYVALHLDRLKPNDPRIALAGTLFPGGPTYSSPEMLVYTVPASNVPPNLLGATEDSEDWGPVEGGTFRWTGRNSARLYLWSGSQQPVQLHMRLTSFAQSRTLSISADGQHLASGNVGTGGTDLDLEWFVPRGFTTLLINVSGAAITPQSLGMGSDSRPLIFNLSECRYSAR